MSLALPALVLLGSYGWLAVDHGTPWLWRVVIHESGRYTLAETVFYLSHFLREVPVVAAYALFILGMSGGTWSRGHLPHSRLSTAGACALTVAFLLVVAAFLSVTASDGWSSAWQDLLQYRTRDDLSGYGTHWRYHWLATMWFGAAMGAAPLVGNRLLGPRTTLVQHDGWTRIAWAWFLGLTLVFGISADVFMDPRYAGHQAREIMTHALVTLPLGIGIILMASAPCASPPGTGRGPRTPLLPRVLGSLTLLIPAYLAVVTFRGDIMEQGQSELGLGAMVAAHYFEHTLDYALIVLLLTGVLLLRSRSSRPLQHG